MRERRSVPLGLRCVWRRGEGWCGCRLLAARRCGNFRADRLEMFGHLVREADTVDDGDGREYGENPEDWGHHAPFGEERAEDDENNTLGAFHESDFAGFDERFGTGAGVTYYQRGDHDKGHQHDVEEAVAAGVKDEQIRRRGRRRCSGR